MKTNNLYFLSILFLSLLPNNVFAQVVGLDWGIRIGGMKTDISLALTLDPFGNIITSGFFEEVMDIDPGPETLNFTVKGCHDMFIQKLNPKGQLVWAKQIGGLKEEILFSITSDKYGNVYSVGTFQDSVDFDPGPESYFLKSEEDSIDIFILKLDPDGNFVWANQLKGSHANIGQAIITDSIGNVFVASAFRHKIDCDPGPETLFFNSLGDYDLLIQKLNPDGKMLWTKQVGGSKAVFPLFMNIDHLGNIYTVGYFEGISDFDPGSKQFNLKSIGGKDVFILKMTNSGNFVWAKQIGGKGTDIGRSVATDKSKNVYITGSFEKIVDFDPGSNTKKLKSRGKDDIFVLKLNSLGQLDWVQQFGDTLNDQGASIDVDLLGNVFTTGNFEGAVDFDPSPNKRIFNAYKRKNIFIQKFDNERKLIWVKGFGGNGYEYGQSIKVDKNKNIFISGVFSDYFAGMFLNGTEENPEIVRLPLRNKGMFDVFVLKLKDPTKTSFEDEEIIGYSLFYHNKARFLKIESRDKFRVIYSVRDKDGKIIFHGVVKKEPAILDFSIYPPTEYQLVISSIEGTIIKQFINY